MRLKNIYCIKIPLFAERLKMYEKLFISVIILSFGNLDSHEVAV